MRLPPLPRKGDSIEQTVREIIGYLRWSNLTSVVGGELRRSPNGATLTIEPGKSGGGTSAGLCPFGELMTLPDTDPPARGIRGGVIYCGDQNWNMDPQTLNLEAAGAWLVSIEISVEANRDDDGEILLPGIKTGTRPTGDWKKTAWSDGTDYPDNTSPVVTTGIGKIYVPLGKLTIADGSATFEKTGCGNITLTHCAGTLAHTRG